MRDVLRFPAPAAYVTIIFVIGVLWAAASAQKAPPVPPPAVGETPMPIVHCHGQGGELINGQGGELINGKCVERRWFRHPRRARRR